MTIAAGQQLSGDEGQTTGGRRGYEGMCPPDGVHTYRFAVFASGDKLQVDTRTPLTIDAFEAKYGSQVLAKAQVTGKFYVRTGEFLHSASGRAGCAWARGGYKRNTKAEHAELPADTTASHTQGSIYRNGGPGAKPPCPTPFFRSRSQP